MKFYKSADYQPNATQLYNMLYKELSKNLPWADIEHIGASSVPDAISKGDLDVLVRVSANNFKKTITVLEGSGFQIKQDTHRDHQLCMFESAKFKDAAIQLIEEGSQYEFFITFRDRLIAHKKLLKSYNNLKMECEGMSEDEYRKRKSEFINRVLNRE